LYNILITEIGRQKPEAGVRAKLRRDELPEKLSSGIRHQISGIRKGRRK
jgi:hypothetical protein